MRKLVPKSKRSDGLKWYYANKAKVLADQKARKKANPDKHRENRRKWVAAYRARLRAAGKPDRDYIQQREYQRRWRAAKKLRGATSPSA